MPSEDTKHCLKCLAVDLLMGLVFLALIGFGVWLIYIYFLRGPIDIETRGFVSRTVRSEEVQPIHVEKYRLSHFHNLDDVVLKGIPSESLCVKCHGDYPHTKEKKTRSFFNAHAWFMACEVCHIRPDNAEQVNYLWLEADTGEALTTLNGQPGVYGGQIVPLIVENQAQKRLDILSVTDQEFGEEFIKLREHLDEGQVKWSLKKIHKPLAKQAVFCDECHTRDGLLDFSQLLYSSQRVLHLQSLDMASMVKAYEEFHLPSLLDAR